MKLTPALSAYLDFLRFTAAFGVLLGHMMQDGFALGWMPLAQLSHEAVVVFFVLSGYIVYTSTTSRHVEAREYVVSRASRIYSVALPAVFFCVVFSALAEWIWPTEVKAIASWRPFSVADVAGSLLFIIESWRARSGLTLNGPYWSLCYEVWYYVLFGAFLFVRGAWRWPVLLMLALAAGPSVMVLFPIWILGAWLAARSKPLFTLSPMAAVLVWSGGLAGIWLINSSGIEHVIKNYLHEHVSAFWRLEAAQLVFTDYAIGLALVAHLSAFPYLPLPVQTFFERTRSLWAALAGFSFTLYLFHRPITGMAGALIPSSEQTLGLALVAVPAVLLLCWLIAFATERQLPAWRRFMRSLLARLVPAKVDEATARL